ncbi:GAF domain-containing protein [Deinococcus maricopensis]|uniref:Oxygen sensor histidine kinase NreB n=1 Tax=Deinococcus maricopensis (strain DSM 21211 / LMG 22137 / NRRL B-23946 / LB-34) TaxID=709986 RepID=E8UAY9_DEIML|nr:GAF domain-containing protein [Deinococcus maricopensis]ADV68228.1 multi-sensor signal transduction histidine kinase [Deinococcus maricopensis DSM 21211]
MTSTSSWFAPLAEAQTAAAFAEALCEGVCRAVGAHGVQFSVRRDGALAPLACVGFGLALCDESVAWAALTAGAVQARGGLVAVPLGDAVLEVIGAREESVHEVAALAPMLALAFEGAQAREARRGRGRTAEVVAGLVRRLGGTLDLAEVLTATAESAARAVGFERAFVGLFRELGPNGARTGEVFTFGFHEGFEGGVGVGPESFERLMERGEPILFDRTRDAGSALARGLAELSPEFCVIAPLAARGRPLGVLYVDTRTRGQRVTDDEVWLILALAEQASLAMDNARLYAEESRKRHTAEALREAGVALAGSLKLGDTLERTLERARDLLGADAAAVYELLPDGRTMPIKTALGLDAEFVMHARAKVGTGVVGRAVERGALVAVTDMQSERVEVGSRFTRRLLASGQYPFRGVVGLPLTAHGRVFGGLALFFREKLTLGADELALAGVLGAQAALAIENARLYEEEVRREQEAAVLLNLARTLGTDRDDGSVARAAEMATLALRAERGLIVLTDDGQFTELGAFGLDVHADDALRLTAHLGRGPRRLTRRHCLPGASSALVVPLRAGGEDIGLMYFDHSGEDAPSDRVLQLARAIGDQISLALGQERLLTALAREEARYRLLAHSAHDLIIACDASGVMTYGNPASERLLGPLAGRSVWALLGAPWRDALDRAWGACLSNPDQPGSCDIEVVGVDRTLRLEVRLSAVVSDREVLGMLVVARDISEMQTLAAEITRRGQEIARVQARQGELRSFLALFTQAQEEERRRISRELHDDTAQVLVAIGRRLDRLAKMTDGDAHDRALDIRADLNAAIESVRRFARNLRPSVLDDLGLLPALEWLTDQAATPARLEVMGQERRLSADTELTVFRLVQEALSNVDKHAGAQSAAVRVQFGGGGVQVTVRDDGRGFTRDEASARAGEGHLGLIGLRERVNMAGGNVAITSAPGEGTALTFNLPG